MTEERLKRLKEALDKIDHIMLYVSKKLSEAKKNKELDKLNQSG